MRRRALNGLAGWICGYLCSRSNDIAGYWGIGVLCAAAKRDRKETFACRIFPGKPLFINGCEVTGSKDVTDKFVELNLHSIEVRLSFHLDGRYPHGADKYTCVVTVAIARGSHIGMNSMLVECWPHDPTRESQRAGAQEARAALLDRLKKLQG